MMKRYIVDSDASDIRQTPRAATDMFYLLSVEISRLHPLLGDLNPELLQIDTDHKLSHRLTP